MVKLTRKLFVPASKGPSLSIKMPKSMAESAIMTKAVYDSLPPEVKAKAAEYINTKAAGLMGNNGNANAASMKYFNDATPTPPKGGTLAFPGSKRIADNNTSYALSKAPNPKDIQLNSGVKPNTYANDYMNPVEGICSPLHMTATYLGIPSVTNNPSNPLGAYFANTICFDIQTRAQSNVGFSLEVSTKLTSTQLVTAFNAAIYALQVYFYYSSILSYESDPRNKNSGMIALRQLIDAQTLSDLAQLGRRLEDTPVPPRVVEWIRYMNGNFLSGNTQGSPILKTMLSPTQLVTPVGITLPSAALSGLVNDANNTVFTLLRRAIPQWKIGTLYDCHPIPTFDKQFLSIFANLSNTQRVSGSTVATNTVADLITNVPYNTFSNNLDGLAYAMTSILNTNTYIPGLASPFTANVANIDGRYSYYVVGGVRGFYPVITYPFLALSRQETTTYIGTTAYQPHLFGTDKCQSVSGSSLLQSAQNVLDFLFNVNSIPLRGMLTHFNNKGMNKI
jgi:hypothetical protein